MRRPWLAVVVVLATFASPHPTDAGKSKKKQAESFELFARGSHDTRGGVAVSLEPDGVGTRPDGSQVETWVLRAGDATAVVSSDEPWAELAVDGKLYQAVPASGGLRVTVLTAGDDALASEVLVAKVEAEAGKRRIVYASVGTSTVAGVATVFLDDAVKARVGTWSGKLLSFEVDPYATITPALPAGSKTGRLAVDGGQVTVGGVKASLAMTGHKVGGRDAVADYRLILRKGKKQKVVDTGWVEEPMFEVVALGKLVWVRGDELIVAPAKKLAKRAISSDKAIALVQAEADRRGIPHDGAGATGSNGVEYVTLAHGGTDVVQAVIGARSKKFLRFDVSATGVTDAPPKPTPEPVATGGNAILDEHNRYRAAHCAPALTWSDDLAQVAQAWAEHLRDDACGFYHSGSKYGENLAGGTSGSLSPEDVVGMWYREVDLYDFANGGFGMDTGHFTQVVWKKTRRVGCGMVTSCDGMDLWVCNYDPPGNYDDQFAANVLPTGCR